MSSFCVHACRHIVLSLLLSLSTATASAWASPFADRADDAPVFSGPAQAHFSATMGMNPAAIGLGTNGWQIFLGGGVRIDQIGIERVRIVDGNGTTEPAPKVNTNVISPGCEAAIASIGSKVALAITGTLTRNVSCAPGLENIASEEPDAGYHTLGGYHDRRAWTIAVSFRLTDRIIVGTQLGFTATELKLAFLEDTALLGGTEGVTQAGSIESQAAAQRYELLVETPEFLATQNLALSLGVVYQMYQSWWLGMSVHSPAGFDSPLRLTGTVQITPPSGLGDTYRANAQVIYSLPQTLAVGVHGPLLSNYDLVATAYWQNTSRQDLIETRLFGAEIPVGGMDSTPEWFPRYRGLRDTFALEAGLESNESQRLRLGSRLRLETGSTGSEVMTPLQIDGFSMSLKTGAELRIAQWFVVVATYDFTYYPRVEVDDSDFDPLDYLDCVDSGYSTEACGGVIEGRAMPSANGSYSRLRHALGLSLRYELQ